MTSQRVLPHEHKPHRVYVLRDSAQRVLYVGVSSNVQARIDHHRYTQPWREAIDPAYTTISDEMPWEEALATEQAAIQMFEPAHNKHRTNGTAYVNAGVRARVAEERKLTRAARNGGPAEQKALDDWHAARLREAQEWMRANPLPADPFEAIARHTA